MNVRVQTFARRWWSGQLGLSGGLLGVLLAPLSGIWRGVTHLRNLRYDRGGVRSIEGLTVVSVGNLAVGGTGKTPVASWVAVALEGAGARPALLLRGYGRDEALLHRVWTPELPVYTVADRVEGAREAAQAGADVVVLDDGFQHRRLARALDIVLLAVEDRFPGRALPCGPYREGPGSLRRASAVVLTRRSASPVAARDLEARVRGHRAVAPELVTASVQLSSRSLVALADFARTDGAPGGSHGSILEPSGPLDAPLVVAAVARPHQVLRDVALLSTGAPELLSFSDHHDFTETDAARIRERAGRRPLVISQKDAVKLRDFLDVLGETWVLSETLDWDWGEEDIRRLLSRVAQVREA